MIDYGKEPSGQMRLDLPGFGDDGWELLEDARHWRAVHYDEWQEYMRIALHECRDGAKASPNYVLQTMRNRCRCEVPNAYAPCFARLAMNEDRRVRFRTARSKVDGFISPNGGGR